jgi:hypothetical protein
VGGLLGEVVRVALRSGDDAGGCRDVLGLDILGGRGAGEDVQFVFREVFECGDGDTQVFGEDFFGVVCKDF